MTQLNKTKKMSCLNRQFKHDVKCTFDMSYIKIRIETTTLFEES